MIIKNFVDCPHVLPTVARWLIEEFFVDKPEHTVENMVTRMQGARRDEIPLGLISFEEEVPTGVVSLLQNDLGRPSPLTPWLAGLYVAPQFRGKGIGKKLVSACVAEAKRFGFDALYLYSDIPAFYESVGWKIHSKVREDSRTFALIYELVEKN